MKREGTFTVQESNGAKLIRWNFYGFRSSTLKTQWIVEVNGQQIFSAYRKKDALPFFEQATKPLRERLCTPMTVGQGSVAMSTVI